MRRVREAGRTQERAYGKRGSGLPLGCYDEGRLRLVILDIDDCVVLQQDVENLQISVSCRIVQCGVPQLVLVVHIRLEVLILEVEDLKHKVVVVGFGALNQLLVVLLLRGPPVLPRVVLPSLQLVKVLLFVQTADRFDLVLLPDIVDLVFLFIFKQSMLRSRMKRL